MVLTCSFVHYRQAHKPLLQPYSGTRHACRKNLPGITPEGRAGFKSVRKRGVACGISSVGFFFYRSYSLAERFVSRFFSFLLYGTCTGWERFDRVGHGNMNGFEIVLFKKKRRSGGSDYVPGVGAKRQTMTVKLRGGQEAT